jgi:hypothetical protein
MNLTPYSHMSFNIFINGNLSFENENIYFTTIFIDNWNNPETFLLLEQMDVCTSLNFDKNLTIFKN